ncbi:MAG: hypothetical protein HN497_06370 [Flavobacteriaceae bacterium]|nr:hypothetical protein [Flavobacteriaceae bacterium]
MESGCITSTILRQPLINLVLKDGFVHIKNKRNLTIDEFANFSSFLGKPLVTEKHILNEDRTVQAVANTELFKNSDVDWHNDWSYGRGNYFGVVLYNKSNGDICPTQFIDMKLALDRYNNKDDLKDIIGYYYPPEDLHYCFTEKQLKLLAKQNIHRPFIFEHHVTGEKVLYFSPGTLHKTSRPIDVDKLLEHCLKFAWQHEWEDNDIIVYDNIRVMHKRDAFTGERLLWRTQFLI